MKEHTAIIIESKFFEEDSYKRKEIPGSDGVMKITAKRIPGKMGTGRDIYAFAFPIDTFTVKDAKEWLEENEVTKYMFEPYEDGNDIEDGCGSKPKRKSDITPVADTVSRIDYGECLDPAIFDPLQKRFTLTPEGYLTGRAIVTNVGVFPYIQKDGTVRRELRLPEEVFNWDSLESLKMLPLTNEHPAEAVTSDNIKQFQVGHLGSSIDTDPYHVSAPIVITDKDTIEMSKKGKRALSCEYSVEIEDKAGVWCGVAYDAVQRNIRYNHVALVDRGRAGDAATIKLDSVDGICHDVYHKNDQQNPNTNKEDNMLKKITLDGVEYEAEETVIKTLHAAQSKLDALEKEHAKTLTDLSAMTAERDSHKDQADILKKDLEDLKVSIPANVDTAVKNRLALMDAAQKAGIEVKDGMTDEEVRKAVIEKAFPKAKEKLANADGAYIAARFDSAIEFLEATGSVAAQNAQTAGESPAGESNTRVDASDSHRKMVSGMTEAWKQGK